MGRAMTEVSLTDDAGQSHELRAEGVGPAPLDLRLAGST